jgi:hypothetical protein
MKNQETYRFTFKVCLLKTIHSSTNIYQAFNDTLPENIHIEVCYRISTLTPRKMI